MKKPEMVNILGKEYKIEYVDKPSDVDIFKRESLWGQIDYWTRTIRIYDNRERGDIFDTLLHEILHGITLELKIKDKNGNLIEGNENIIGMLGMGLADTLSRNGWLTIDNEEHEE